MGERVLRRELAQPLPGLDGLLVPTGLVVGHREAVPGVDEVGIDGERRSVRLDRLLELPFPEEVDGPVVELVGRRHRRMGSAFPRRPASWGGGR